MDDVGNVRRRVMTDGLAISFSAFAFGLVYGLAAREGGFSIIEAMAMSTIVLAGAAQFAAVGLVAAVVLVALTRALGLAP